MTNLTETIEDAKKVMIANKMPFATIWKTGKNYGFNFDKQAVGFTAKEYGIERTVVMVINNQ